jgi:hypothetical protein
MYYSHLGSVLASSHTILKSLRLYISFLLGKFYEMFHMDADVGVDVCGTSCFCISLSAEGCFEYSFLSCYNINSFLFTLHHQA